MEVQYREGDLADLATEGFVEWIDLSHLWDGRCKGSTHQMCAILRLSRLRIRLRLRLWPIAQE